MNRRQIYEIIICLLALVVLANVVNAQSKDKNNPTRLTSNKISSPIYVNNSGETFYYRFEAGPGDIIATLNVDPERRGTNQVVVDFLLSETGKNLTTLSVYAYYKAEQQIQRFTLSRRQMVIMKVWFALADSQGRYELLLAGATKIGKSSSIDSLEDPPIPSFSSSSKNKTDISDCLPKQGTLIIKMKDGSKKIIDLSKAETITVVP